MTKKLVPILTRRSLGRAQSPTMNGLQYYNNLMGDLIEYNGGHLEFKQNKYCYFSKWYATGKLTTDANLHWLHG